MPEEEANKCPSCDNTVDPDEVLHSTLNHGDVCSDCYDEMWNCDCCRDEHIEEGDRIVDINGEYVCFTCASNEYYVCDSSGEYFNHSREDFYSADGHIVHSDYAEEYEMDTCCHCGCSVYINEVYSDHWENANKCYDCYENAETHISDQSYGTITGKQIGLSKHYRFLGSTKDVKSAKSLYDFKRDFYGGYMHSYENSDLYLIKSNKGYGADFGWWDSSLKVASQHYRTMATYIRDMISHNMFIVEHKKYGLYHPLRDIFKSCIKYYDRSIGEVREGKDITLEALGSDWLRYTLDFCSSEKIIAMLKDNKTEDGANLKKLITNVFNRSYKNRISGVYPSDSDFHKDYNTFQTNSSNMRLPVRIGYDADILKQASRFNRKVGSCQVDSNNETYAFGMMDMITNPHLFLLIYDKDGDTIIGRSIIKFYKQEKGWGDKDATMYIAPSRLYLTEYTNAKKDVYASMYEAVNQFGKQTFGDNYKLLCHKYSRHDNSIKSIIRDQANFHFKPMEHDVSSEWWHPYWLEKPSSDEAEYTYYQDESATTNVCRMKGINEMNQDYAVCERIRANEIEIIEVKEKEINEQ